MDKVKVYVGIDVSKGWLDFATFEPGSKASYTARCANTRQGINKVFRELRKHGGASSAEMLFCLEHTGAYCARFLEFAAKVGLLVWQESAWKIKRAQSPRGKSDVLDAARIAEYAYRFRDKVRLWAPEPDLLGRLRGLLAMRDRLVTARNMLVVPKCEASGTGMDQAARDMAKYSDPAADALSRQVKEVDAQIDQIIAQAPEFQKNMELACSIPAIGRMTALSLILYTRNFSLFDDPRKLACYCGVAPFEHTSGSSIRGKSRVSHFANKSLKKVIHMAAVSSVRYNPDMRAYFARKVALGKNKMSVINAVRNKLLHCVMAVIKRQAPWEPRQEAAAGELAQAS